MSAKRARDAAKRMLRACFPRITNTRAQGRHDCWTRVVLYKTPPEPMPRDEIERRIARSRARKAVADLRKQQRKARRIAYLQRRIERLLMAGSKGKARRAARRLSRLHSDVE